MSKNVTVLRPETGRYSLDNSYNHAERRLGLIARCYDPSTTRRLEALPIWPGWRCLEVGAGGGSIARWLAQRVGAQGEVVATDIDTRHLDAIDVPNVTVWRHDVVTDVLPAQHFDLVHARAVLCHLPAREEVLSKLVTALRPGGWLLLEEADTYPQEALATGDYAEMARWAAAAMRAAGADLTWARGLAPLLSRAGLLDVASETEAPIAHGGTEAAELLALTFTQLGDRAIAAGAPAGLLERACAALDEAGGWFPGYGMVAAWGRRAAE